MILDTDARITEPFDLYSTTIDLDVSVQPQTPISVVHGAACANWDLSA